MQGGDISNELPQKIVVALDCILLTTPKIKKTFGITTTYDEVEYNQIALSRLWNFGHKTGFTLELTGFGRTRKEMKEIMEDLDNSGTNPFNYFTAYRVPSDLVSQLPYRPEVKNVIDISSRGLMYGHWFLEFGGI